MEIQIKGTQQSHLGHVYLKKNVKILLTSVSDPCVFEHEQCLEDNVHLGEFLEIFLGSSRCTCAYPEFE